MMRANHSVGISPQPIRTNLKILTEEHHFWCNSSGAYQNVQGKVVWDTMHPTRLHLREDAENEKQLGVDPKVL